MTSRRKYLRMHWEKEHEPEEFTCQYCNKVSNLMYCSTLRYLLYYIHITPMNLHVFRLVQLCFKIIKMIQLCPEVSTIIILMLILLVGYYVLSLVQLCH